MSWPQNTKETIAQIIDEIGREVTFYTIYSSYACDICTLDPVHNTSTDSFCPICSGNYWIPVWSGDNILAHVTWKSQDLPMWATGGRVPIGDCLVKVMLDDQTREIVDNAKFCVVDDKEMSIEKITPLGAPTPNRIMIDLKEKDREHNDSEYL